MKKDDTYPHFINLSLFALIHPHNSSFCFYLKYFIFISK